MKQNIGNVDRIIRVVIGPGLIALGVYFNNWWGAIGLIPLITAAIGWCPLYVPFGLTTKSAKQ